ncbi:hypothetical protein [Jiella sonneratiae]|uniref:Uncharacterized protein n=1 Tax=Jiella sonneratiae TaxID=2816856 RepID=A0ABS3IXA8_9HYPH|nr:hypothetical protein [Jiella sonneratiae]MBO0902045.1 hypothetical protein [Jiella sonneratiae]
MQRPILALLASIAGTAFAATAVEAQSTPAASPAVSAPRSAPSGAASSRGPDGYRLLVEAGRDGALPGDAAGIAVMTLPRPANNPGPQRDIAVAKRASGPDLAAVAGQLPDLGWYDRSVGEPCRIDWSERCGWLSEALAADLKAKLRDAGAEPAEHSEPYYYVSRFGPAERLLVSRTARFGDGDFTLVFALADRDGNIETTVALPLTRSAQGLETGDESANLAVLAASQDDLGAVYLTVDTPSRCGDRPRRAGLLVKTDADVASAVWVSPFNVSDTNVVINGDRVYAASGGSCEKDYLYELDAASGTITGRNLLPTAADFLVGAGDHLLLDLYEGAMGYRLR